MIEAPEDYLIPVKGHNNLFKNKNTGMVVSINNHNSAHYKRARQNKLKERQELDNLKSEVSDIKSMLKQLLEKING